ncbi:unnamed protein product [Mytilus coruscus]|uniref:C-type lectin domain-containing protein n=1 Tax=Mytilus coruscus TaxID=42192 RepID=A0A6J8BB30_MYTCO|nr:unnamed protein product [Mytilus coruscus]
MDQFQILVSVFLTLWKSEELTMQHVTFSNTKKSWKSAVNHCSLKGGVLESNVTLLREQDEFKTTGEDVWIGKLKTLTNWTYIRGCYSINGNLQHFQLELSNTVQLQCQMLCVKYKFYSVKAAVCYCIENISSFVRSANCNCVGCYKVWEHQLPDFGTADKKSKCIASFSCDGENFERRYRRCSEKNYVICDNDVELGYVYDDYKAAAKECERQGSFIKWHSDNLCNSTGLPKYWTSGTRHYETFVIKKAYFIENLQPDKCFKLKDDEKEKEETDCNDKQLNFFCRFEKSEDASVQSDDSGNIAAGTVTAIIVVIAVISVLVFIHRRWLSRKKPTSHESQNNICLQVTVGLPSNNETSKAPVYHEIDSENFGTHSGKLNSSRAVNNITYDQSANSYNLTNLNSIAHQQKDDKNDYDMAKVINVSGNFSEGANSSNYCLAKPMTNNTEEESDPYDINKDYDHLNNVIKKEDPITKVYDHLPTTNTEDPTYDHSNLTSASDNGDYYDHFKIDGNHD